MLDPEHNRLDYGDNLKPPAGAKLDFAVGTTYSLDLGALIAVCIALGLKTDMDSAFAEKPVFNLRAIRAVKDRALIFFQQGQITVPPVKNVLYSMLDEMLVPVVLDSGDDGIGLSFHAKTWVMRYRQDDGSCTWRVMVLSRNLTFDKSWDVALVLDGVRSSRTRKENTDLSTFLSFLGTFARTEQQKEKLSSLAEEILQVEWLTPYQVGFYACGIGGTSLLARMPFSQPWCSDEIVLISPFLSENVVRHFNRQGTTLVTRRESLSRLKKNDVSHLRIKCLKDGVIDASIEEGGSEKAQDIHAKVYWFAKKDQAQIFLGSCNASDHAFYRNVEFMVSLSGKRNELSVDDFLQSAVLDDVAFEEEDPNPEENQDLSDLIRRISGREMHALVTAEGDRYMTTVTVKTFDLPDGYRAYFKPLQYDTEQEAAPIMKFGSMSAASLSSLYVLRVEKPKDDRTLSRAVWIETSGIPKRREDQIMAGVICGKSDFVAYLNALFTDNPSEAILESADHKSTGENAASHSTPLPPALYEKMLRAAVQTPERFQEIGKLIRAVGGNKDTVPEEFSKMYSTFQETLEHA